MGAGISTLLDQVVTIGLVPNGRGNPTLQDHLRLVGENHCLLAWAYFSDIHTLWRAPDLSLDRNGS